jgi:predicted metal-binding membrane protein
MSAISDFSHLTPAAHWVARYAARPQLVLVAAVCVLVALGASILGLIFIKNGADSFFIVLSKTLCGPGNISSNFVTSFLFSTAIWSSMAFVMMLPGAAPMLVTYAEIADTAAAKGIAAVSPLILTAGYLAVWIAFAVVAGFAETISARYLALTGTATGAYLAGTSLLVAGVFQFSTLKHACLSRCRRPFTFFFANWTDKTKGVFRLGVQQGLLCLGCCWALMLTMLALGSMNLIWMIALAVVMTIEKTTTSELWPRFIGGPLILAGVFVLLSTFNAWLWPLV